MAAKRIATIDCKDYYVHHLIARLYERATVLTIDGDIGRVVEFPCGFTYGVMCLVLDLHTKQAHLWRPRDLTIIEANREIEIG